MVPEKTPNLKLKKPDYENGVADIRIFNENWDILDEANKKIENEMAETNDKVDNGLKTKLDKGSYEGDADDLKREIDGKEPAFSKKSGFNLNKTDSYEEDDTNKVGTARALKRLYDWIRNKLANLTLSWDRITNKPNLMTSENVQTLLKNKVDKAGDTMSGVLKMQGKTFSTIEFKGNNSSGDIGWDGRENIFFRNTTSNHGIRLNNDGSTNITASNLESINKEIVASINETSKVINNTKYKTFPITTANINDVFYHIPTSKFYICKQEYSGTTLNNPNSNFIEFSVLENNKNIEQKVIINGATRNLKIKKLSLEHDNINPYGLIPRSKYSDISEVIFAWCTDVTDYPVNYHSGGLDVYKISDEGIRWTSKSNQVGGYDCFILGY